MAKKLGPAELVSFKELLMAYSIQIDALCQLLIEKGLISQNIKGKTVVAGGNRREQRIC